MISRYLVIALALGAAVYRTAQGAFVEAAGLAALGAGLIALKLSASKPALRIAAYACFGVTAISIAVVLMRQYL